MELKIGVFDHLDDNGEALSELYEQRLQLGEVYDREGFHCYHLAEHHSTPIGLAPSPSVFLSAMAQRTDRLRLAPLVYLLPFYHPIRLIEEICMIDQLSGGRLEIGTGRGISPIEASFYGILPAEAARRYEELFAILRSGLTQTVVTFVGEFYSFDNVPMQIAPLQNPFPAFWYGVHAPASAAKAARLGFNVVTNEGPAQVAAVADAYRNEWRSMALTMERMPDVGMVRHIVVADTDEEAYAIAKPAFAKWNENFYHLHRTYSQAASHDKASDIDAAIAQGTAVVGSPETVLTTLWEQVQYSRVTYLLGQFAFGDLSFRDTIRSLELFTEYVMPILSEAGVDRGGGQRALALGTA